MGAKHIVSILVLLDVFLEADPRRLSLAMRVVSILVLLDVLLEDHGRRRRGRDNDVSILVLLDVSLEVCKFAHFFYDHQVSILVLLDVSLEESCSTGSTHWLPGFNPCSLGCFPRRVAFPARILSAHLFQSLFSWMFCSKALLVVDLYFCCQFQSLFSWMFCSKSRSSETGSD